MPNNSALLQSIYRLQHLENYEFLRGVDRVLAHMPLDTECAIELANRVEERLIAGFDLSGITLARVIAASRSLPLYRRVRERILRDEHASIILYENQFPDKKIENALLGFLWVHAKNETQPKSHLLTAIASHGSATALTSLEALREECRAAHLIKVSVAQAAHAAHTSGVSTNENLLALIAASASAEFMNNLQSAIDAVRARAKYTDLAGLDLVGSGDVIYEVPESFVQYFQEAREKTSNPRDSIKAMREATEALARHIWGVLENEGLVSTGGAPRKLEELIGKLKQTRNVPATLLACFTSFQHIGNVAHHPAENGDDYLSSRLSDALLTIMDEALHIYQQWAEQHRTNWEAKNSPQKSTS